VPLSLHNVENPHSCAGFKVISKPVPQFTSTAYWQTRMRTSSTGLLRHRPSEARLATCALQGRYRTDSDDPALLALSSPKKFLRMFLCRPGTLAASFVPYVPPFHPRLSSGRRSKQHPVVPRRTNHVCSTGYTATRDPAA
jgi:hypothetical protein